MSGAHQDRAHAKLSPSGASRWLACTPSALLEAEMPDKSSDFAKEGTLAHEFAELELRSILEGFDGKAYEAAKRRGEKSKHYSAEMPGYVSVYTDFVLERLAAAKAVDPHAFILLEERLHFAHVVPGGFGSGDAVICCEQWVEIIDLKYGRGVKVSAKGNPQLRLYAIGAVSLIESIYGEVPKVYATVVQPRLYHVETEETTPEALNRWADEVVRPRAELAAAGKGEFVPGDHCKFCKVAHSCRALADQMLALARHDFMPEWTLTDAELREVWDALPLLTSWAKSVADHLHAEALAGRPLEGLKLVLGKGRRKWADEKAVIKTLRAEKIPRSKYMNSKLAGIGDVSNLLSKDDFERLIGPFVEKTPGAPVLVLEDDPREPFGLAAAKNDFQ